MTGTDYNAIVNDRNRPTATVRPKSQPNHSHAIGADRPRGQIQMGQGYDAHLYPYKRRRDEQYILESERDNITRRRNSGIKANRKDVAVDEKIAFVKSEGWILEPGGLWSSKGQEHSTLSEAHYIAKRRKYDRDYRNEKAR